jgi:hypothetical protein
MRSIPTLRLWSEMGVQAKTIWYGGQITARGEIPRAVTGKLDASRFGKRSGTGGARRNEAYTRNFHGGDASSIFCCWVPQRAGR